MALQMLEAFMHCWVPLALALAVPCLLKLAMKLSMQDLMTALVEVSWSDYAAAVIVMLLALLLKDLKDHMKTAFQHLEHIVEHQSNTVYQLKCVEKTLFLTHTTIKHVEGRLERLVQEGCESVRHIVQICEEYDMKRGEGSVRWPKRKILEEQSAWSSARSRFGELGTMQAFQLVVEAARRQVKAEVEDTRWKCSQDWLPEAEKKEQLAEADRLEQNLKHLAQHEPMFQGRPEVEDVQKEMLKLMKEWMQKKGMPEACLEDEFFTTATSFLARDLKVYDGEQ